jgi:putative peptidoglycan lipid II flippase
MAAFVLSNLVGLLRGILIYRTFGTTADLDAFNAANRITEVLFNLMAGGALGSAFIPAFTGYLTRLDRLGAWRLASAIANLLLAVLTGISLLAWFFAPQVVRYGLYILLPGEDPVQEALTVELLRLMLPTVVIFGLSGLVMGILNAHQRFWLPAIAPAFYSLGMIAGLYLFPETWGIHRLAWGVVIGASLHLLVQSPALLRLPERAYTPAFDLRSPAVREVLRLMLPRIFGVAIVQLNFIVNTIIALSLPEGSVSSLVLAFSLMLMPQMAIAQSIAIASLPTFSAQVARGHPEEMRASLAASLRGVLLLATAAAVGLILLRRPIIQLLYEDGVAFTAFSTELVAWALLWYALGLVSHSVVEIVSRAYYALHDTRTPVLVGAGAMGLNVVLSFVLADLFGQLGWFPHGGLALANTLATTLEMIVLLILMRKRLEGLEGRRLLTGVVQAGLAVAIMGVALAGWLAFSAELRTWVVVLGGVLVGGLVYGAVLFLLRVPELRQALGWLLAKLRRSPAP